MSRFEGKLEITKSAFKIIIYIDIACDFIVYNTTCVLKTNSLFYLCTYIKTYLYIHRSNNPQNTMCKRPFT